MRSDEERDGTVSSALNAVADAAEETARESADLAQESRQASREMAGGTTARSAMESGRPQRIFHIAEATAKRLLAATGALRKAFVSQLRAEGTRVSTISRLFGVSHQRISALSRKQDAKDKA